MQEMGSHSLQDSVPALPLIPGAPPAQNSFAWWRSSCVLPTSAITKGLGMAVDVSPAGCHCAPVPSQGVGFAQAAKQLLLNEHPLIMTGINFFWMTL